MKKVILFGDSIFNAYDGTRDTDRFAAAMRKRLGPDYQVENISTSGATVNDVLPRVDSLLKCDILVVEYGTNDSSKDWGISLYDYQEGLESLLKKAQKVTGAANTLVLSPSMPDFKNPKIASSYSLDDLDQYSEAAQRDAGKTNSFFFDLTHKMERLQDLPSFLTADGQHYSEKGISWLADVVAGEVSKMD